MFGTASAAPLKVQCEGMAIRCPAMLAKPVDSPGTLP